MYKNTLRDIVEIFYQAPFKIFNVNSTDGKTMIKPIGYFISLGITTSLDSLRTISDYISRSDYGFESRIVELESRVSEEYGDFINTLSGREVKKYPSIPPPGIKIMGETEATEYLQELTDKINSGDYSVSVEKQKLSDTLRRITNWDEFCLQIKDGVPGVFHKYVNYQKNENSENRIGIYVTKI